MRANQITRIISDFKMDVNGGKYNLTHNALLCHLP